MINARYILRTLVAAAFLVIAGSYALTTQPASPPPPDKYKASIRYRIVAGRDEHVAKYKTMVERLQSLGFEFEPKLKPFPNTDYEDPNKNLLTGLASLPIALKCLEDPSVASILLVPANYQFPAESRQPIRVRLELASGFTTSRQLVLANQVRALLGLLDFKESTGYDDRGYAGQPYSRIVGTIPAENLDSLLKDLRSQPSGWLAPQIDAESLPLPLRNVSPILVTEVISELTPAVDAPLPIKRGQSYLDKITPDLWAMLVGPDDDTKIVRTEIILSYVPPVGDESYRPALEATAPSLFIEGRLGPVVTGLMRVNQANALAGLQQVSVVRLARPAQVRVDSSVVFPTDNAGALKKSGLEAFHQLGNKGKGKRIGIVDSDFRSFETFIIAGKLPQKTSLVDLTAEFNPDLFPDPPAIDELNVGHGTHCALAAALAAPEAELTLIRIDPTSLVQLQFVAKIINGDGAIDEHIIRRIDELHVAAQVLEGRREELIIEREAIQNNFADDSEFKRLYDFLGPAIRGWLFTPREWHALRMTEWQRDHEQHKRLETRFHQFHEDLRKLKGLDVISTSLVWNDGYPLGGGSALSRWFDETQGRNGLWLFSVGNTLGQAWTMPFRDANDNGFMEFAPPGQKLPAQVWTPELNFLAWRQHGVGGSSLELPAGAKLRVSVQWSEPHDPSYFWQPNELDRYLKPLEELSLSVLRQRDPSGKFMPADDFEVVARSATPAFRIENRPSGSVYEQLVEFTVPKAGRYALRVSRATSDRWELRQDPATGQVTLIEQRGLTATGIRPPEVPNLPALEAQWELQPRIFVSVVDPSHASKGRAVFRDFSTYDGNIPLLADARSTIAVGAVSLSGEPQPYSAFGSPGVLWGYLRPNVFAYDSLALVPSSTGSAYGTSLSTSFVAGMAATMLSAGERPQDLQMCLQKLQAINWRLGKER